MTDWLANFHFLRPAWLLLLLPAIAIAIALWRVGRAGGSWQGVIAPELLQHLLVAAGRSDQRRQFIPALLAGWTLAAIAVAGPSWERLPQPVMQKQDALVILLDLSYSMWAEDLQPSRIDRARRKLLDLLDQRTEGQTALVAFAGDAHVVTPLTDDNPTIANLLPALDPGMMPVAGSDAVAAVSSALRLLEAAGINGGDLLIVTDGISAADIATITGTIDGSDTRLSVLGIGTVEGAPIPLPEGGFLKRDDGSIVIPQLDEKNLRSLATRSGGIYRRAAIDDSDLAALMAQSATRDRETRETERLADAWADMAHWFCLPLLPLLLYSFRRGLITILALLAVGMFPAEQAKADWWEDLWYTPDQQGMRALQNENPELAARRFENPQWQGTAAYRAENYAQAVDGFGQSEDADGLYNKGNALARAGRIDEAIDAYRRSLELQPDSSDAAANLALLESMRDQQEQNSGDQDQQGSQSQDEKGDNSDQRGNQQQDNQGRGDSQDQTDSGENDSEQNDPQQAEAGQENQDKGQADNDSGDAENAADSMEVPSPQIDTQQALAEDLEEDQALQQWLRRVPDDPSGLLREKFRYESRKRQRQGQGKQNEQIW